MISRISVRIGYRMNKSLIEKQKIQHFSFFIRFFYITQDGVSRRKLLCDVPHHRDAVQLRCIFKMLLNGWRKAWITGGNISEKIFCLCMLFYYDRPYLYGLPGEKTGGKLYR